MADYVVTASSLERIARSHFYSSGVPPRERLVETAEMAHAGPYTLDTSRLIRRGAAVYQCRCVAQASLLLAANAELRHLTGVKQSNRDHIVDCVASILSERSNRNVYRFDVHKFFDSVNHERINACLDLLPTLSVTTRRAVDAVLRHTGETQACGLPRGLALSATLSELYMSEFDERVSSLPGVRFFARFVDDVVLITTALEDQNALRRDVVAALGEIGLQSNDRKFRVCKPGGRFTYLGYEFVLPPLGPKTTPVQVGLGESKIARFRRRIALACLGYIRSGDFALLVDRIRFLAGNVVARQESRERAVLAGVYYSYPRLSEKEAFEAYSSIDRTLAALVLGRSGRLSRKLFARLSPEQRKTLLRISFVSGFRSRCINKFSRARVAKIVRCWSHV